MIWYSYKGVPYEGDAPAFYNLSNREWFVELQNRLPEIQQLALGYLTQEGIEVNEYFNQALVSGQDKWKVSPFLFWGKRNEQNIEKGKVLFDCFAKTKGLTGLAISILPPNTSVKPHYGDTDAVYRIHIPVKVPDVLPACGLKVNGIEKSWEPDKIIAFSDAHLHEAWNYTAQVRIVIIADVLREEFAAEAKNVCLNVLSLLALQKILSNQEVLQMLPGFVKGALRILLKTGIAISKS